jgi:acyl-coenzyme A synthetase/AMP-(fatty) acid ligase
MNVVQVSVTGRVAAPAAPLGDRNAGFEVLDRWVRDGRGSAPALRWRDERFTYAELLERASRFGGMLHSLGVQRRDVVVAAMSAIPELVFAMLGTIRYGGIFGVTDILEEPLRRTRAKLLLLEAADKPRVDPLRSRLDTLWHVVALERFSKVGRMGAGDFLFADYFEPARPTEPIAFGPGERALIMASTGQMWGHAVAPAAQRIGREVLGLEPGDACSVTLPPTHPMWPVVGVLAPLSAGAELVLGDAPAAARVGAGDVRLEGPCPDF